jgi:glycosyltransferase involved in cell wall biosynthesis
MQKIKILYYDPSSGFGGSPRSLRDILLKLDKDKFHPIVAVIDDGPAIRQIRELGFDVRTIYNKKENSGPVFRPALMQGYMRFLVYLFKMVLPLTFKLSKLIKKEQIDIVHVNTLIRTGLEAIFAARLSRIPVICHLRSTCDWTRIERLVSRIVSKSICLTEEAKTRYRQYTDEGKLIRIYNGIDLKKYLNKGKIKDIRKEFGIDNEYKVVGIVGRITEGKGHDIFLKAARLIIDRRPKIKFLIVGDSLMESEKELKNSLIELTKELGIFNNVIFTGWREDALDIISNMDVLVQASTTFPEGFSRTCIEAMALGTPLVVSNIPGHSEIVVNSQTGYIVPAGNIHAMAEAVLAIIKNKSLSNKFSENGRRRVEDVFNLNKIVKQIENIYFDYVNCF